MRLSRLILYSTAAYIWVSTAGAQEGRKVSDALKCATVVEIPGSGYPVERTVADCFRTSFARAATVVEASEGQAVRKGHFRVHVNRGGSDTSAGWFRFRVSADGTGELTASHTHFLYTAFCRIRDDWSGDDVKEYLRGQTVSMGLPWLEGNDRMFATFPRLARNFDPEMTVQELARLGCSHLSVNVLASSTAFEQGVPGEVYPRCSGC